MVLHYYDVLWYLLTLLAGTSNWTEDYFSDSAGISITLEPINETKESLVTKLTAIFHRDWNSKLAIPIKSN